MSNHITMALGDRPEWRYDLDADPGQKKDVASENPAVLKQLLAYAEEARADLGDGFTQRPGTGRRPAGTVSNPPRFPSDPEQP